MDLDCELLSRHELKHRYQEDATSIHAIQIAASELKQSLEKVRALWDPSKAGSAFLAGQVAFFGIYDGYVNLSL